ncbi:MAG: restriction endonuclease [Anaerolineales bacterium]|nr:restriction endonuclease [Anaerolineales bacterium]
MPKRRHRFVPDGTLLAIMALFVVGGLLALGFLGNLSKENRALIVITSNVVILGCFAVLIFLTAFRKQLRRRVWLRTMSAWKECSQTRRAPNFVLTEHLSENGLRHLAIQAYSRMGYRIANGEDEAVYIQMINPDGGIELVACKQKPDLLELHHVYSLQLEMKRMKAVRGYVWSPAGFTSEAISWAVHRPIVLADQHEIGRLVDCANAKGSRFLEY